MCGNISYSLVGRDALGWYYLHCPPPHYCCCMYRYIYTVRRVQSCGRKLTHDDMMTMHKIQNIRQTPVNQKHSTFNIHHSQQPPREMGHKNTTFINWEYRYSHRTSTPILSLETHKNSKRWCLYYDWLCRPTRYHTLIIAANEPAVCTKLH